MNKLGQLLTKHRNAFLVVLLAISLALSGYANQQRLLTDATTVDIPVAEAFNQQTDPLERFRQERESSLHADVSALTALINQHELDANTREQAADQLQAIVDAHQAQKSLEGALVGSSLYPCIAVVQEGSLTIVTRKAELTQKDSALVMTLAAAHTGISPENIRIITAE